MAILKKKIQTITKTLTIRLPSELINDIDKIRTDAAAMELDFDVTAIVIDSLTKAVKSARTELERN